MVLRVYWQDPAPARTRRAWACGVLPKTLQEFASLRFKESVREATVEGERRVLMTLLFVSGNQKVGEKRIFLRHTFNLATVQDKKMPAFETGSSDVLVTQLGGQTESHFIAFANFYDVDISIFIRYRLQDSNGCLAHKIPEYLAIKLLQAGTCCSSAPLGGCSIWPGGPSSQVLQL